MQDDYEKLGLFYLGRTYDPATRRAGEGLVLYDSRDLVTHAVCVGMTGSGKTGLCISLLEEAAIDHVPAIAIDPKGDLTNLLLTFPELRGEDFAPWVDAGEAAKSGQTTAEFAAAQAQTWKAGLAEWGQDGARIRRLKESADFRIYTPGSSAGLPVSILGSFAAPVPAILDDPELFNERVATTASSLLGLLGVEADPLQSREHILVSHILSSAWNADKGLDLPDMIRLIQSPPFDRVGVMEVDAFYPAKDRFALSLKLNNLVASPGFETWLKGEPLDIDSMLHAPDGKPRVSIVSVAHLGESERMFFVSLLLNQVLSWVRTQPGTSSLRAILYMDEIYGYFPPVATPPSKKPLMTLLKQARAYGLGVVLATQNPADLDYKGLSNAGTWFLGRLQAERDKARVLEGLEGAAAAQSARFDRQQMDTILSGLGKRTFLLHNVHDDRPEVFQVRWALSYLRGPLTRQQIKRLMTGVAVEEPAVKVNAGLDVLPTPAAGETERPPAEAGPRPALGPDVPEFFVPIRGLQPAGSRLVYRPKLVGLGEIFYSDAKSGVCATQRVCRLASLSDGPVPADWTEAARVPWGADDLENEPSGLPATYEPPPAKVSKVKSYAGWSKAFVDALYRVETLELLKSPSLNAWSTPDESERDFRVGLQQKAREARDAEIDRIRTRYAQKLAAIEEKVRKAEAIVDRESDQARSAGLAGWVHLGTTVLGAVVGRKSISNATISRAGSAVKQAGKAMKESADVGRAEGLARTLRDQYLQTENEFRKESHALRSRYDPLTEGLETVRLRPKKTNITAKVVALAWTPYWSKPDGETTPAWG